MNEKPDKQPSVDRRQFLVGLTAAASAMAMAACGDKKGLESLLQKRFRELSKGEVQAYLDRLKDACNVRYGRKDVVVDATPALDKVQFAMGLDLSRCIGCRSCVYACVKENNQSRDPQIHWISVLRMKQEAGTDLSQADLYYDPAAVPEEGASYMPVACQHCRKPPCTAVCPVSATYMDPDGIVVIDYDWCIGCRCCMAACPYGARHFNWGEPKIPPSSLNPKMHVMGNRPRPRGVVEKCTFCVQRTRQGRYPACVEACPVGARKFGNMLDPKSEIRYVLETRGKGIFILKEELATDPKFFYFFAP